jgi:hypothetical protein
MFRAANNWTTIQLISSIPLANLKAVSNDMNYAIYNNTLYRYNPASFQYDNLTTFPSYKDYTLQNVGKRLLISGRNEIITDNNVNPP